MKTLLLSSSLLLVASAAFGQGQGLHMTWTACPNTAGASAIENFICSGNQRLLHGTFSLATSAPGVVSMDGILDLLFESPGVPPFWQFEAGACNETGIAMTVGRPASGCTAGTNTTTLCNAGGLRCPPPYIMAYGYGSSIGFPANRARLLFTITRVEPPVTLTATTGTNHHFAFTLTFFEDNALEVGGPCEGCLTGVSITWNKAVFYNTSARSGLEAIAAVLSSSDPGSDANVWSNCPDCQAVSSKPRTWGRLKTLYR